MLKFLIAGVWGALMTGAGIFVGQTVGQGGDTADANKAMSTEVAQVTTEITGAPIIAEGKVLGYLVFRITHTPDGSETTGAQRIFRGQPSIPGESLAQGATGTGQMTVTVRGQVCYIPAV